MKHRDEHESAFGEFKRTAAAAAAEAAAGLKLHNSAAQTATEAMMGLELHKSAARTATEAMMGLELHKSAAQTATEAMIGLELHKSAARTAAEAMAGLQLSAPRTATEAMMGLELHKSAARTAAEAMAGLQLSAARTAAEAIAGLQLSYTNNIYDQVRSTQIQLLKDLTGPSGWMSLAEIARQAIIPLSQAYSSQAATIAAEVAPSLPRANLAALATAALTDLNISTIGGNSIATAFAAFQAEQAKGFESLRLSFAGIAADALKHGLESLSERDEQAFTRFEQLINEKIDSLPRNQVTAESLLKFLLMLFIALGSLGAEAFLVKKELESSTTQAEQHTEVMNVLERIAVSVASLTPEQDQNVYYVAERRVALKLKPKNSSHTITTIFPNQKTRLVQMNHQWIYVEYFDYLEGIPKYGWANKKCLKKLNY